MDRIVYQLGGEFSFDARRRQLLRGADPVPLPSRAALVLELLIRSQGRVVTKEEITELVWGNVSVGENNLHQSITALR
jgi:DNA-binding winged helix-turn-helix (wHTH) protein